MKHFKLTGNTKHDKEGQRYLVEIECECGNVCFKTKGNARDTKTCGLSCPISSRLKSEALKGIERELSDKGTVGLRMVHASYKKRAKKKGLEFDLGLEEFKELTSSICHYCGEEPSMIYMHKITKATKREMENAAYAYNSLDRIDPTKGYIKDNVRPSCKVCNIMKWDHTEQFFKERVKIMYEHYYGANEVK